MTEGELVKLELRRMNQRLRKLLDELRSDLGPRAKQVLHDATTRVLPPEEPKK
jgi:hypothetical protein